MIRVYCGWRFECCRKVGNNCAIHFMRCRISFAFFELSLSPFVLLPMMMIWRLEGNLPGPHLKEERWFNGPLKGNNLISLFLIILAYFALPFFGEFDLSIVLRQCVLIHKHKHTLKHICNIDCVGAQMVAICAAISDWLTRRCWLWGISVRFRWTHPHWCPDYG